MFELLLRWTSTFFNSGNYEKLSPNSANPFPDRSFQLNTTDKDLKFDSFFKDLAIAVNPNKKQSII